MGCSACRITPAALPQHAYLVALKSRIAEDKARLECIIARLEHMDGS